MMAQFKRSVGNMTIGESLPLGAQPTVTVLSVDGSDITGKDLDVNTHACTCLYADAGAASRGHVCMHAYDHGLPYICPYMCPCTCLYTCSYTCLYICLYTCLYTHACAHVHAHVHTHVHTPVHAQVQLLDAQFNTVNSSVAMVVLKNRAIVQNSFAALDLLVKFVDKSLFKNGVAQFRLAILSGGRCPGLQDYKAACPQATKAACPQVLSLANFISAIMSGWQAARYPVCRQLSCGSCFHHRDTAIHRRLCLHRRATSAQA